MKVEYSRGDVGPQGAGLRDRGRGRGQGDRGQRAGLREEGEDARLPARQDPDRRDQAAVPRPGPGGRRRDHRQQGGLRRARGPRPAAAGQPAGHRPEDRREPADDLPRGVRDPAHRRGARLQGAAGQGAHGRRWPTRTWTRRWTACARRPARYDPVEGRGPRASGDFVVLDVAWTPQDGGKGGRDENVLVEVGAADNHKDLNAALVGHAARRDASRSRLVRRATARRRRSAGKTVDYTLTVKAVKTKVVPARRRRVRQGPRRVRAACGELRERHPRAAAQAAEERARRPRGQGRARRGPRGAGRLRGARRRWSSAT